MVRAFSLVFAVAISFAQPVFAHDHEPKLSANAELASTSADAFLTEKVTRVLSQLGSSDLSATDREQRFRSLVTEIFDVDFIARFVLGSHWSTTSEAERARFRDSLVELQVQRWAQRFRPDLSPDAIALGQPMINDKGHHLVPMTIVESPANPTDGLKMIWVMRKQDGVFKVFDVVVGGTSILVTYKQEYQSFISRHGSVEKLTDEIEKQVIAAR